MGGSWSVGDGTEGKTPGNRIDHPWEFKYSHASVLRPTIRGIDLDCPISLSLCVCVCLSVCLSVSFSLSGYIAYHIIHLSLATR